MATAKKKAPAADQAAEPTFTKEQLVKSKTLNLPRDAVAAILEDGSTQRTRPSAWLLIFWKGRCKSCLSVAELLPYRTRFFPARILTSSAWEAS